MINHDFTDDFRCFFYALCGAPVAQWVKRWATDLAVPGSSPAWGEIFSTINGDPLHTAFHNHTPIVLIWLEYCWKGCKIASHPSTYLCFVSNTTTTKTEHRFHRQQPDEEQTIATRPRGYKTFFMLNSAEHEIVPAHKCYNANNCWHFKIYVQEKLHSRLIWAWNKLNFLIFLY